MLNWLVGMMVMGMAAGLFRSAESRPAWLVWVTGLTVLVVNKLGWWS